MKRSVYFCIVCIGIVIGASCASYAYTMCSLGLFFLSIVAASIFTPRYSIAVFLLLVSWSGMWWYAHSVYSSSDMSLYTEEMQSLHGEIKMVQKKLHNQQLIVAIDEGMYAEQSIVMYVSLYPEYRIGDSITAYGRVKKPAPLSYSDEYGFTRSFSYDTWLAMQGIVGTVSFPKNIQTVQRRDFVLKRWLYDVKTHAMRKITRALPGSEGSLVNGILFGVQDRIDPDLREVFRKSGLTHVVALSGFNITIIAIFFLWLAPWVYISRYAAIVLSIIGIGLFTIMTGAGASIVRAAIMGSLTVLAYALGRPHAVFPALLASAAGMALWRPLVVAYDVGFQLSFLATIGLLLLYPVVERTLHGIPERFGLRELCSATITATIMTAPLSAYVFGTASLVSLLANLLVVPVISGIMAGGALILVSGWLPLLENLWSVSTWFVIQYVVDVTALVSKVPHAFLVFENPPVYTVILAYTCITCVIIWHHRGALLRLVRFL